MTMTDVIRYRIPYGKQIMERDTRYRIAICTMSVRIPFTGVQVEFHNRTALLSVIFIVSINHMVE